MRSAIPPTQQPIMTIDQMTNPADESRRRFMRDILAATGWVFLGGAELVRSGPPTVTGDPKNGDKAWGRLKGRILFDGDVPERKEIDLAKSVTDPNDLAWFKSKGPVLNEEWVVDKSTKAVHWVYVWLLPVDPMGSLLVHESLKTIPEKQKVVEIDQLPTGYSKHAVAMRARQSLLMKNTGPVFHTFSFLGTNNPNLNAAMPAKTEKLLPDLKAERSALPITCTPHPWERMWLRIFDHPYFAITAADGTFEIPFCPAGECRMVVWHEAIGFRGGRDGKNGAAVTIAGAATTDVGDITIKPKA
jgi:hypothetical protein